MNNNITLQSYESAINLYVAGTPNQTTGNVKTWIDTVLSLLTANAQIIEIGSAFGRDAEYIESQGFSVERTDAVMGFVDFLQQKGYSARNFNVLTDDFDKSYDLIFANAVFLHFTPDEFQTILSKIHTHLSAKGLLAFSLKIGEGEEWSMEKVDSPRYFCYWTKETIQALLTQTRFEIIAMTADEKFMQIIARPVVKS